jgi:hypothetical protein
MGTTDVLSEYPNIWACCAYPKSLIITGTSSNIIEMTRVYAFLNTKNMKFDLQTHLSMSENFKLYLMTYVRKS